MRQTRVDPLDHARMIVYRCVAREACKTSAGTQKDFKTALRDFERYLESVQIHAPTQRWTRPIERSIVNEAWSPRGVALWIRRPVDPLDSDVHRGDRLDCVVACLIRAAQ